MVCIAEYVFDSLRCNVSTTVGRLRESGCVDQRAERGNMDVVRIAHIGLDSAVRCGCILGRDAAFDTRSRKNKKVVKKRKKCLTFAASSDNICKRSVEEPNA